ncbi:MAG: FmdB family transcriptional regulator [Isosphaera sp.]|nr:FmdB family transcriptional regulator [Isosphaera sp.]
MPTYDYECSACGHRFDELQSFSDPPLTRCPACKKNKLGRRFGGGGAVIFKGGGFYETDYRRAGEKPESGDAPKADAKPDAKPEAKADATPAVESSPKPAAKPDGKGGGKKAK